MKKTRRPPMLSMNLPGARAFTSSRCLNSARISSDCAFAQGVTTSESAPTRTAIGMMKRSVGSIQERERAAAGGVPDDHFVVLPPAHHRHQHGDEARERDERARFPST